MKIDRLLAITIYLLNHGKTSAHKLSQLFEVSPRTIMRDMETLELAGIPIISTAGINGGYEILNTYVMEKQLLNDKEYTAIITALKGLSSAYEDKSIGNIIEKMNSFTDVGDSAVAIDLSAAHENQDLNDMICILEKAITDKCIVGFEYTNNSNETKYREAEPVKVVYKWYNWYLIGYYEKYEDYCMFKLSRMEQLKVTEKKNTREHDSTNLPVMKENEADCVTVRLHCKKHLKSKCREYLNGKVVTTFEDGDFEFEFSVPEKETFWYGVVLSFGKDAKVISPQSVRDRIITQCMDIIHTYYER